MASSISCIDIRERRESDVCVHVSVKVSVFDLKAGLCDVDLQLGKGGHIFGLDEFVSIDPAGLMEPEPHQIHRGLQALGSGKQQTLCTIHSHMCCKYCVCVRELCIVCAHIPGICWRGL